ncbi:hypothetical protein [Variovorax sp. PCZ-1]|uniref:hypothetical protein n=1 Tax=Variovorax sp. PCZ-1 TaxID=2835533 RepID=UPI001BCBC7AA|nr:hypothetical protein [Variovorax sp. PCZ-1]MBS7806788.1 hypothetical protein [Variovorax sp. PCZ-1]
MNTLLINIFFSLLIFVAAYRWILRPVLPQLKPSVVLIPILLLHSMRHLGLMFLTTGVTSSAMPKQFAVPAAAGDFLSAVLAFMAACLIQRKSAWAIPMTWLFSIVGIADFAMAVVLSRLYSAADFMGGAYWIPSFWVPMLIVGHIIVITVLRQMKRDGVNFSA